MVAQRTIRRRKTKKAAAEKLSYDSDSEEDIPKPSFKSKTTMQQTKKGETSRTTRGTVTKNGTNTSRCTTSEIATAIDKVTENETNTSRCIRHRK